MEQNTPLVNLTINGVAISVPKGTTVYTAAKQLNFDIPVFCYLDRMPPFGACRMCLVEVEKSPKLQASCTLEATEGMVVRTQSDMALKGRESVLELLLVNHPLDCPICDRGGECPLQDHTLKYGPGKSRFYEEKRHFKKQLPLGPVLMLDRERCIVCARCTRFGDLIAGDHALEFVERGFRTEVGTPNGRAADSKFIGNTIKICPVGALTSRVYRFRARPWDNEPSKTTCTLCPVGCSMSFDSRDGEIMRTLSVENKEINDIWLCDKGWFGYEFSNHDERLQTPLIRRNGTLQPASWDEALSLIAEKLVSAKNKGDGKLAGFGGAPLTFEENYLFQRFMREIAGVNHVDYRVGMTALTPEQEYLPPGMELSIGEVENLNYVLLLGLDLTEEFPVIWLRLKHAINHGAKVIFIGHFAPEIAPHLHQTILHAPGCEVETLKKHLPELTKLHGQGNKGSIFIGRQYLANPLRGAILQTALEFQKENPSLSVNVMEGKDNSMGARAAGMHPFFEPLGKKLSEPGLSWMEVLESSADSGWDFLYVAGANVAKKTSKNLWDRARHNLKFLVVQDLFLTKTAQDADVVLPTLCYAEKKGTFINIEGRSLPVKPGKAIPADIFSDGEIFTWLAHILKYPLRLDPLVQEVVEKMTPQKHRIAESKNVESIDCFVEEGSDALRAAFSPALFDQGERMKHNPHLIQLAKSPRVRINRSEASKRGLKDLQEIKLIANGIEIRTTVKLDDAIADKTIVIPLGFDELPAHEWGSLLLNGLPIKILS